MTEEEKYLAMLAKDFGLSIAHSGRLYKKIQKAKALGITEDEVALTMPFLVLITSDEFIAEMRSEEDE